MTEHLLVVCAFLFSIACGFVFIPLILNFCKEKNLYDIPNSRKVHSNAVPRLGGICFLPSMFIAFLFTTLTINSLTGYSQVTFSLWSLYFFISLLLVYCVGFVDDLVGLGARSKFTVQIIAAALLPAAGLYVNTLYGFMGINEIPYWIGAPLTVFIIVFINNAMNLIDGIDGLSASLSFIALAGFLVCFVAEGMWLYGILIAGLMGVLVAFLYFNLFGKPENNRKIFMGDSGSLTLGFILGFLAVKLSMDNPQVMASRPDSLIIAFTLLAVPVMDVVRVSLMRIWHGTPVFRADKNHIHHKLMRCGLNQHKTLVVIVLLALFFIALNGCLCVMGARWQNDLAGNREDAYALLSTLTIVIDIVVWVVFHIVVNWIIRRNERLVFVYAEKTV